MKESDILIIKKQFDEYTSSFLTGDKDYNSSILLKTEHSYIVMNHTEKIINSLGISGEKLFIAKASALLHDIGRFEQFKRYKTFSDKESVNHGKLGKEILDKLKILTFLDKHSTNLIKTIVRYHNSKDIPDFIDAEASFFLDIIRDADKIDIFRVVTDFFKNQDIRKDSTLVFNLENSPQISKNVFDDFMNNNHINFDDLKTVNDFKVIQCGWLWDFTYTTSLKFLLDLGHPQLLVSTLPDTKNGNKIKDRCNSLFEKIEEEKKLEWMELSRKKISDCSIFSLHSSKRVPANGKEAKAYLIEAHDWVTIIPVIKKDEEDYFVMVRQYRHGLMNITTEFPAGTLEDGEEAAAAALRELEEETGFKAGKITYLGSVNPNPAFLTNTFTAFLAEDLIQTGTQNLDENEYLNYEIIPATRVIKKMGSGDFYNGTMLMALMYYLREKGMVSCSPEK